MRSAYSRLQAAGDSKAAGAELLRCVYDYRGADACELTLRAGDLVDVSGHARGVHWAEGTLLSSPLAPRGVFPLSHCVPVAESDRQPPPGSSVVRVVDGDDEGDDEGRVVCVEAFRAAVGGEIDLAAGDVLTGVSAVDSEWWSGTVEGSGARGLFPSSHVAPVPSLRRQSSLAGRGYAQGRGHRAWAMVAVVAYVVVLSAALAALLSGVDMAAVALHDARLRASRAIASYALGYAVWVACVVGLASASYAWTLLVSPYAAGSGTSQVRSIIGGARLPAEVLSPRTLVAKAVGVVLSAGSGLFVWLQGANVHIAACFAALLLRVPAFRPLEGVRNLRTLLMSTAVTCTLSAQFGTPIGAVLYGVESAAAFIESSNYWVSTVGALVSAFVTRVIFNLTKGEPVMLRAFLAGVMQDSDLGTRDQRWEMSLLGSALLVGLTSALLAMAFLKLSQAAFSAKNRLTGKIPSKLSNLAYLLVISLATSVITFPRLFGDYLSMAELGTIRDLLSPSLTNSTKPAADAAANTASLSAKDWGWWGVYPSLLLLLFFRFSLTSVSPTLPVPLGVYEPCLLIGMVYGRLVGEFLLDVGSPVPAALCGLMGATAFTGSVHNTFSAALIVLELVGTMEMFIPLLVATSLSILFCRYMRARFIVQQMSDFAGVPQQWENFHLVSQSSHARQVMAGVLPLARVSTIDEIERVREHSVPVVPVVFSMDEPYLLGEISADALPAAARTDGMSPDAVGALLRKQVHLDYSPAACIAESMPLHEVYTLFSITRLSHAFVVRSGKLVGLITSAMLMDALAKHDNIL
eukprot:m51a1_g9029 putative chloride channel type (805) ;mRNA; f:217946-220577